MTPQLHICIDGAISDSFDLDDGNDSYNNSVERGVLDRAYEAKASEPDSVVTILIDTEQERDGSKLITFTFDVSHLTPEQLAAFSGAIHAQTDAKDTDYVDVPAPAVTVTSSPPRRDHVPPATTANAHEFTLAVSVAGGSLAEARSYVSGLLEVGDGEERLTNIDIHDGALIGG